MAEDNFTKKEYANFAEAKQQEDLGPAVSLLTANLLLLPIVTAAIDDAQAKTGQLPDTIIASALLEWAQKRKISDAYRDHLNTPREDWQNY